jgi:hypothetical protein
VLAHRIVAEEFDGHIWRIRILARVGVASAGDCGDSRRMFITMYPPRVRVSPAAPAWADALAHDLGFRLAELAEADPAVAGLRRADRQPNANAARDRSDYRVLTGGTVRPDAGGHGLFSEMVIEQDGRDLRLSLGLRLEGPAGERIEKRHDAAVRLPRQPSVGRLAVLGDPERAELARALAGDVLPTLSALLHEAGCRPALARIERSDRRLVVPLGRAHGLKRTSLAFTVDQDASTEMLEIAELSDRGAVLSPLDPARAPAAFAGRPVRFLDTAERAW